MTTCAQVEAELSRCALAKVSICSYIELPAYGVKALRGIRANELRRSQWADTPRSEAVGRALRAMLSWVST